MRASAFCVVIEPQQSTAVPLSGYGGAQRACEGSHLSLEANGIVFRTASGDPVLLVSIDTLFVGEAFSRLLVESLSVGSQDWTVVSVASHTHFAPALDSRLGALGSVNDEYLTTTVEAISAAARKANVNEHPLVAARAGASICAENISRRRESWVRNKPGLSYRREFRIAPNRKGPTRHQVDLVELVDMHSNPIAIVWSWPCHPVTSPYRNRSSSDFPGAVRETVRRAELSDQLPVLYLPGFAGDQRQRGFLPEIRLRKFVHQPFSMRFPQNTPRRFNNLVDRLAKSLTAARAGATDVELTDYIDHSQISVPLNELISSGTGEQQLIADSLQSGEMGILALNAEVCAPYYDLLRRPVGKGRLATGYGACVFGYLPSSRQVVEGGYEASRSLATFGIDGSFHPEVDEIVASKLSDFL